jgi:type II secretory pathway pseudopilin PulG
MKLEGQARNEHGYAMAVLLVSLSIMAIMLTVAMPVWKQTVQREKEEELIFRGTQYVHAIALFQRKTANAYPPNIDLLVRERYLRKKFKDPITNDDFLPLPVGAGPGGVGAGQQTPGATPGRGQSGSTSSSPITTLTTQAGGGRQGSATPFGQPSAGTTGGVSGVASKSKEKSIRIYNGRTHYNEWTFVYVQQQQAPGAGGVPGAAAPGRGTAPTGPGGVGGRGGPPNRGGPTGPNRQGGPGGFGPQRGGFPTGVTPIQPIGPGQPGTPRGRF